MSESIKKTPEKKQLGGADPQNGESEHWKIPVICGKLSEEENSLSSRETNARLK